MEITYAICQLGSVVNWFHALCKKLIILKCKNKIDRTFTAFWGSESYILVLYKLLLHDILKHCLTLSHHILRSLGTINTRKFYTPRYCDKLFMALSVKYHIVQYIIFSYYCSSVDKCL